MRVPDLKSLPLTGSFLMRILTGIMGMFVNARRVSDVEIPANTLV
jgi:hypothetical protein